MAKIFTSPFMQPSDINGVPLAGALLYFYAAGTTTLITVYADAAATTPRTNPVVASAEGIFPAIYVINSNIKTVLKTSAGVTVQTIDNIGADAPVTASLPTKVAAVSYSPIAAPDSIQTSGYTTVGDGGAALYKKVGSQPSHAGKFSITLTDTVTVVWYELAEVVIDAAMLGTTYGATSGVSTPLASADAVAVALSKELRISGLCRPEAAVTLSSPLTFVNGGVIRPATAVKVTLAQGSIRAGLFQIFDRSSGGAVEFGGSHVPEVYAEWWGARGGVGGRTDNQIPIQHAIDALQSVIAADFTTAAPNDDNNGGILRFGFSHDYKVSGKFHTRNRVQLKGLGRYTEIVANAATWDGTATVWLSQNGILSQFWCRAEDLTIDCSSIATIVEPIYAPAWQECCGMTRTLVRNFTRRGLKIDNGYGGAKGVTLDEVQFFPAATASLVNPSNAIDINMSAMLSHYQLNLRSVSFAGTEVSAPPGKNLAAVFARGNVIIKCDDVFIESFDVGFSLENNTCLYGDFRVGGNPTTTEAISLATTWVGDIDVRARRGGASKLLRAFASGASQIYQNGQPYDNRVVYPLRAGHVLASDFVGSGATTPVLRSGLNGLASISKPSTGLYQINFDSNKFAPTATTEYTVDVAIPDNTGTRRWYVSAYATTYVQIQFTDAAGSALDVNSFILRLLGRDGV